MSLPASELQDLEQALSDRLYIQINGWHLYLGDAKLARPLAIECSARIDESAALAARKALEAVAVPVAGTAPARWNAPLKSLGPILVVYVTDSSPTGKPVVDKTQIEGLLYSSPHSVKELFRFSPLGGCEYVRRAAGASRGGDQVQARTCMNATACRRVTGRGAAGSVSV